MHDYQETRPGGGGADGHEPRGGRDLQEQIATLAAQVRRLGERLGVGARAGEPGATAPANARQGIEALGASIIEAAEGVAAEIRSSAEREADRVREGASRKADVRLAGLAAMIDQHRETILALADESERIERTSVVLRTKVRALEGELQAIRDTIAAMLGTGD